MAESAVVLGDQIELSEIEWHFSRNGVQFLSMYFLGRYTETGHRMFIDGWNYIQCNVEENQLEADRKTSACQQYINAKHEVRFTEERQMCSFFLKPEYDVI